MLGLVLLCLEHGQICACLTELCHVLGNVGTLWGEHRLLSDFCVLTV